MERRVLIAIVLSFLVLYGYQALFVKPTPPPSTGQPGTTQSESATPGATAPSVVPLSPSAAGGAPASDGSASTAGSATIVERDIRVETRQVIATFSNRGARLKSWRLKDYKDEHGEPLELVAHDVATNVLLPFTLQLEDAAATRALDGALYAASGTPPDSVISAPTTVTFELTDNNSGLRATKSFTLQPSGYVVTMNATVSENGQALVPTVHWGPAVGDLDTATGRYAVKARGLYSIANRVTRLGAAEVTAQPTHSGDFQFAGVDDHYFMTAAVSPGNAALSFQHITVPAPATSDAAPAPRELVSYSVKPAAAGPLSFYIGPKDFNQLAAVDRFMVRAIDFGYFDFVIVPLLRALNWIYGGVGNYGWAIIILTILINGAMFPLRHKSVVSMRKMQEVQPEAQKIQERYAKYKATDPEKQKMNQELMALYRERGVNPASGCVPMLLTLPVLIAFYNLLTTAIELRGAPFMGWIHDLSLPDPYYVTPVLMLLSQIWQTRITPQAGADPAQQRMMMFMPVIMMFFFLWAPAGVAIYWFVSNLWGIGQQYLTTYLIGPPNVRIVRPAAERRVKRVGSGKTDAAARES